MSLIIVHLQQSIIGMMIPKRKSWTDNVAGIEERKKIFTEL
jgi:hypothetical protein